MLLRFIRTFGATCLQVLISEEHRISLAGEKFHATALTLLNYRRDYRIPLLYSRAPSELLLTDSLFTRNLQSWT